MAWENRGPYGPYYTRSKKVNGRVVRQYVGSGRLAEMEAIIDAKEREQEWARQQAERKIISNFDVAEQSLLELCSSIDALTRAVLYASGYHQHKHGEWRYKRGKEKQETC